MTDPHCPPSSLYRCQQLHSFAVVLQGPTLPEYQVFNTNRFFRWLEIVFAMSLSRTYVSGALLEEVGIDASETRPLLSSTPHARTAEMARSYPFSHDGDSNVPFATNAVGTTFLSKEHADLFSEEGKSNINSTWDAQSRYTSPSIVLGPRKGTLVIGSIMLLSLAVIWFFILKNGLLCHASSSNSHHLDKEFPPAEVQYSWGAYTPYFSVEQYTPPPPNCRISQVR